MYATSITIHAQFSSNHSTLHLLTLTAESHYFTLCPFCTFIYRNVFVPLALRVLARMAGHHNAASMIVR